MLTTAGPARLPGSGRHAETLGAGRPDSTLRMVPLLLPAATTTAPAAAKAATAATAATATAATAGTTARGAAFSAPAATAAPHAAAAGATASTAELLAQAMSAPGVGLLAPTGTAAAATAGGGGDGSSSSGGLHVRLELYQLEVGVVDARPEEVALLTLGGVRVDVGSGASAGDHVA